MTIETIIEIMTIIHKEDRKTMRKLINESILKYIYIYYIYYFHIYSDSINYYRYFIIDSIKSLYFKQIYFLNTSISYE